MMRAATLSLSALVAAAFSAGAQTLESGSGRVDVTGTAPSACVVTAPPVAVGNNARIGQSSTSASEIVINQLIDLNTGSPRATSIAVAIPIICNTAHRVLVTTASGQLTRVSDGAPPAANGFRDVLPYGLRADWAGFSVVRASGNAPLEVISPDGAAGDLGLSFDMPGGGAPLVAGDYVEFITVELKAEY